MSLIQDNSYKAPKLSRKHMLYIFGGLVVLLVVAQLIQKQTGAGKSARELEYIENLKKPATAADSLIIDSMYAQLHRIYDRVNAFNFDTVLEFGSKPVLDSGFEVKVISFDLLEFMFDSLREKTGAPYESILGAESFFDRVSETAGQGGSFAYDFSTRHYKKAFAGDARYLLSDRYVTILVSLEYIEPVYHETINEFDSGLYDGAVMLFDISTQQVVAYMRFSSTNSPEVESKKYVKGSEQKATEDDLEQNVRRQVDHFHQKYLGQAMQMY